MTFWESLYAQSQVADVDQATIEAIQFNHVLQYKAEVNTALVPWMPSPAKGIVRILLERDGGEQTTRATSIVAYEPNSQFASHTHPLGEEFFVLAGTFSDENGDYPAGSYVRNPPMSFHQPFSREGCLILVKLQQFHADDREQVVIDTAGQQVLTTNNDWSKQNLFDTYESVELSTAMVDTVFASDSFKGGVELLVLSGSLTHQKNIYQEGHWLRLPPEEDFLYYAKAGTQLWIKSRHLDAL